MKSIRLLLLPLIAALMISPLAAQEVKKTDDDKAVKSAAKKLVGIWKGDADKTEEQIDKMKDADFEDNTVDMVLQMVEDISVEFKKDSTFEVSFGDQEMAGDWEAKKAKTKGKKTILTVYTKTEEAAGGEEKSFEIHFLGKTHIMMVDMDENGPPIVLKKHVKEKDKKASDK